MVKPSEVGERAEAAVLAALTAVGRHVLIPLGQRRFDFAYEDDGRLVKVQCKTGVLKNGVIGFWTCSISRQGDRRDYRDDADFFGVYCHDRSEVYLIPVADVPLRHAHLRVDPSRNHQVAGVRLAAPYLISTNGLPSLVNPTDGYIDKRRCTQQTLPMGLGERAVMCCAPVLSEAAISVDEATATAAVFKALGDPHRVKILNLLATADEPVCVCDINAAVGLSQPTVSFHLKKLLGAGLVAREQRGTWAYYSVIPEAMQQLARLFETKESRR